MQKWQLKVVCACGMNVYLSNTCNAAQTLQTHQIWHDMSHRLTYATTRDMIIKTAGPIKVMMLQTRGNYVILESYSELSHQSAVATVLR